ncbi:hypothetical protein A6V39_00880 [Candidatus Mycoplasma haematobovis]|uniref:Uncharacterized protein n=1 Tax=Candidatus Mycoplasma haematobovis TaxID=432608 RepID=A0A1A9QF81_9MOLU|nr:hypothetical protein [Candidatus Mycoplasma haematobovis]OAL10606.1 hypothetical protein A6V39_00880 [Candidatus Mycoplasma haematobovis]
MSVRRLLYFSGVIPTVFGGGTLGWWFGRDKTIEDALRRIGQVSFDNEKDFRTVYDRFKDSEGFKQTIPSANSWKSVVDWCKVNLALELNEKHIKEVLPKVLKYCTQFKEIEFEDTRFPNFGGLMSIVNDNTKKINGRKNNLVFMYGKDSYCANNVENPGNGTQFRKCTGTRSEYPLYVEPYGLISPNDNDKWKQMLNKYLGSNNIFHLDLKNSVSVTSQEGQIIEQEQNINNHNINALSKHCHNKLLRNSYKNTKDYDDALKLAVTWCTDTGLDKAKLDKFLEGEKK